MIDKVLKNTFFSILEKSLVLIAGLLSSAIIIRNLGFSDFGIIGTVAGYYVFVQIINVGIEAIIYRDHKSYDESLGFVFSNIFLFFTIKTAVLLTFGALFAYGLSKHFNDNNFYYAVASINLVFAGHSFAAPYQVYASSKFKHKIITSISLKRYSLEIFLLFGLFYFPSLEYLVIKDTVIFLLYTSLWVYYGEKHLKIPALPSYQLLKPSFITEMLLSCSLWNHFLGVITNLIYKSDTFFLSMFTGLSQIGSYKVALDLGNTANIIPQILTSQNNIVLSHTVSDRQAMKATNRFLRLSLIVGLFTLLMFILFGEFAIETISGKKDHEIYKNLIKISVGLIIVKSIASPLMSYLFIKASIKELFLRAMIPTSIATVVLYYFSAKHYGPSGISLANIPVSLIWLLFVYLEARRHNFDFSGLFHIKEDLSALKDGVRKIGKKFS